MLNLIVKSIIKQFNIPEAKADAILDDATEELLKLASNIETEEAEYDYSEDGGDGDTDNVEG
ncbi:hypothetical protein GALMADRAFT_81299 [Galerina marginata CBS 339.88]|uniref:Uncharacterized protein n=1 Tax=Galerina marginata (strain CBS 339.88) TaxID=685588 RepID=A0A067S559_GALM3|nr:hypothetical protein GALMADRAFT_81299 [Galerina marginata CBS 339.88]